MLLYHLIKDYLLTKKKKQSEKTNINPVWPNIIVSLDLTTLIFHTDYRTRIYVEIICPYSEKAGSNYICGSQRDIYSW